ncbi:MAG: DUF4344 domain-containing metallopeptidase [Kofleriaceae bacterium]|nr:DUF4344 domain-containing metallopeptidase [Kofleriaceae bacterium]
MQGSVSARRTWAVLLAACLVVATGCKKDDKKTAAGAADPAATKADPATADPAADPGKAADPAAAAPTAPPPGAADLAGPSKDQFGALKLDDAAAAPSAAPKGEPAAKVDPASISKAGIPTMQVRGFAGVEQTGFRVSYAPSQVALHEQFREILQNVQLFEKVALALNQTIKLPRTVDIQLVDCGTVNAFYDPNSSRIIMCYELLDYFAEMFKPVAQNEEELGNAILGATIFAFFHEAGHGLIHQLDLPATGREEDAVDQFATVILIAGGDQAVSMALAGAYWFQLQTKSGNETPFWDEHAFDGQRFYNILCWIYGSDPDKYAGFVSSGNLPEQRAARCQEEYAKTKKSWEKLLEPFLTESAAHNADIEQAPVAPPPVAADGHQISCEQVADQALQLIQASVEQQLQGASQEQIQAASAELEVQLPAMRQKLLEQCAQEDWPDKDRQCVLDARTLDVASKCGN